MAGATFSRTAQRRAHDLLMSLLTDDEFAQLIVHEYLEVRSPSNPRRVYRIPARGGLVTLYEDSRPRLRLCLQPVRPLPDDDVVAMHKLMIEGNEREYMARANRFPAFSVGMFRTLCLPLDLPLLP
jgi:hypothetical protein